MRIRVIRQLVYEGEEAWVRETLRKSYVQPGSTVDLPGGFSITEMERYQDLTYQDPAVPYKTVIVMPHGEERK